jgi:hypothetical protein
VLDAYKYHSDRQKHALERFKALGRLRHSTDDKVLLKSIMNKEKRIYKEHKQYIAEIEMLEAHIEMLLDNYLDNERMD